MPELSTQQIDHLFLKLIILLNRCSGEGRMTPPMSNITARVSRCPAPRELPGPWAPVLIMAIAPIWPLADCFHGNILSQGTGRNMLATEDINIFLVLTLITLTLELWNFSGLTLELWRKAINKLNLVMAYWKRAKGCWKIAP